MESLPSRRSPAMAASPSRMARPSSGVMIPCFSSIAAWAMLPAMSSCAMRESKAMDELKSLVF